MRQRAVKMSRFDAEMALYAAAMSRRMQRGVRHCCARAMRREYAARKSHFRCGALAAAAKMRARPAADYYRL